jgi:hypothetical protein
MATISVKGVWWGVCSYPYAFSDRNDRHETPTWLPPSVSRPVQCLNPPWSAPSPWFPFRLHLILHAIQWQEQNIANREPSVTCTHAPKWPISAIKAWRPPPEGWTWCLAPGRRQRRPVFTRLLSAESTRQALHCLWWSMFRLYLLLDPPPSCASLPAPSALLGRDELTAS